MFKALFAIGLLTCALASQAIERKPIDQVLTDKLTSESQAMKTGADSLDLAWWLVPEFWESTFRQNPGIPEDQVNELLGAVRNHTVLAIVQADISPMGSFTFYEQDRIMNGLKIEAVRANGDVQVVSHSEPANADLRLLLDMMRPILAQAMGNMGENMYFLPLPMFDNEGVQILSPYETGRLRVSLPRDMEDTVLEIELPFDSLFVPRTCPSGKQAHVSWVYCPWSGEKLSD